jgi:Uma2 family endonuclease
MNVALPNRISVDEFLAWSVQQERGRYELQDGVVIVQQSQNIAHLRLKARVLRLLDEAIAQAAAPCYALPDGATVRIGPRTAYEPDALVAPLPMPDDASLEVPNPVVVIEVLSPSSVKRDLVDKVAGYFQVPSIAHYLVIDPDEKTVIWHRRAGGGSIEPPLAMKDGVLKLDTPGIAIEVTAIFAA